MKALIFIGTVLFATITFGQGYTDLKEYGYKGPVKKITTYYFDTLSFGKGNKIHDKKLWRNKIVYTFNREGNLDSIITFTKLPTYKDTVFISKTAYFYSGPSRFAIRLDANNAVTGTVKYVWLSDTSYQTIENDIRNTHKILSELFLNGNYRDKAGKYIGYDEKDSIVFSGKYENDIDENGLLTRSQKTDLLQNSASVAGYKYFGFDRFGNPTKILLTSLPNRKVFRIALRTFEYY